METKNHMSLAPLDVCTLMACETVSMLDAVPDTLNSAARLRSALTVFAAARELGREGGSLLAWVDAEIDSAKRFMECGEDADRVIDPDCLLAVADAAEQVDVIWMLFETAVTSECEPRERRLLLDAARMLTEIAGLDDLLLTAAPPAVSPHARELREELAEVRSALQASAELGDIRAAVPLSQPLPAEPIL